MAILRRTSLLVDRHVRIIKYVLKKCYANERKYERKLYDILLTDLNLNPNSVNWVLLVREFTIRVSLSICLASTRCRI